MCRDHPSFIYELTRRQVETYGKTLERGKEKRNKGGRPKKVATERMIYRVAVKMAAADYFRLLTRAYEAGVSPSGYMRECFQNGHVKERLSKEHSEHVRKLCGMANNLNQLARRANAGGFYDTHWDCNEVLERYFSCRRQRVRFGRKRTS